MLITIAFVLQGMNANAQPHPAKPASSASLDSCTKYASGIAAVEAEKNLTGYVSVIHALLVRATARKDRSVKAAALAPGQFAPLKTPTAEMKRVARQMCLDWMRGKPTIEVDLQKRLAGCSYFYATWVKNPPSWAVKFKKLGGYCGEVAGHHMFRDPRNVVHAYN